MISVLLELLLGRLRYFIAVVPPQPNSPPDLSSESSSKGSSFPAIRTKPVPFAVGSLEDDEAFGYLKRVIVTPAVHTSLLKFLHINIQCTEQNSHYSQSFSRSYGSNLPTSLTYLKLTGQRLLTLGDLIILPNFFPFLQLICFNAKLLETTNPDSITVHLEPFSTSAFKILT
ncbi:hypothetical protein M0811_14469 [Anaeramoeba ignava]|uniref:Uncharacterized protein n=1 Tax=Anaeramoeba ignava TaxID=1746090 RepID=A0A9Q0RH74_ANAIG|nr:hypothetical protein M0811_14469 [Anaeramoeba ignava]